MKGLKDDILPSLHQLILDMGQTPRKIITDFDHKLMGKLVKRFLAEKGCTVESSPPKHQQKMD